MDRRKASGLVAAVVALVIAALVMVAISMTAGDSGQAPRAPVATASSSPDAVERAVKAGRPAPGSDMAADLRAETAVPAAARHKNAEIGRGLRVRGPPARAVGIGCRVDYSGHVYSDRAAGVVPTMFVLHYTVSRNVTGWGDIFGVQHYFMDKRLGSSHFIMDFEGHCLKMVPGPMKAWTQGNANSYAYSVEIIATGRESAKVWKASPLIKDRLLARLVVSVMGAHGLPLRRVDPVGCVFVAGLTDHDALECENDHHDVSPHFPWRTFMRQVRALGARSHEFPLGG